jgi:RNA polymerase sigma factor (sigma-70 family)
MSQLSSSEIDTVLANGVVVGAVRKAAWKLARTVGFLPSDRKDLRQELRMEIIRKLPANVRDETDLMKYVNVIISSAVKNIVRHQKAAKRDYRRRGPSLDSEVVSEDGQPTTRGELLGQGDDCRHEYGLSDQEAAELRMDIDEGLREAPVEVRDLREAIQDGKSGREFALECGIPLGTVRRRLAMLREPLEAVHRDWVQNRRNGYDDPSSDVAHNDRDGALAVSSSQTCLHEPLLDPTLAACVTEA